jgi:hypothetical protein
MKHLLLSVFVSAMTCSAATTIEVTAKFADVAAGTVVPAKPELLGKMKGVDVLSAPKVTTTPGQPATIEVNQGVAAPDGSVVPLGVTLTIKPTLTEKGNIAFSGRATDRFKHGQRESESLSVMTFVAREIAFKGVASSGSTVLLNGAPATSASAKKDAGTPTKARELVIYLTFKKVVTEEAPKKPVTKTATSKSSTKKAPTPVKKPSSSKSGSSSAKKKSSAR